ALGVLLAGRLAVHVDQDAAHSVAAEHLDQPVRGAERAVQRLHEDAPFEVDDAQPGAGAGLDHGLPAPGCALRVVGRTELPGSGPVEVCGDLALGKGVVAAGEEVQAGVEQFVGAVRGDPGAAGGVLRIADAEIETVLFAQPRKELLHRVPPRLAHDVADEKDFHRTDTRRKSVHTAPTRRSCSPTGTSGTSCESKTSATLGPWQAASVAS